MKFARPVAALIIFQLVLALVPAVSLAQPVPELIMAPPPLPPPISINKGSAAAVPLEIGTKYKTLEESLTRVPNMLEYTMYKMLEHKYPGLVEGDDDTYRYYDKSYYFKPRGVTPLERELYGPVGFSRSLMGNLGGVDEGIDLLTGTRAINESLQLDSIGQGAGGFTGARTRAREARQIADERSLQLALELYYDDNGMYPVNLSELAPNYISTVPEGFTYLPLGVNDYELVAGSSAGPASDNTAISAISPVEIQTHPWGTMIGRNQEAVQVPTIFKHAPNDHLLVYFERLGSLNDLEAALAGLGEPADALYNLGAASSMRSLILDQLGYRDLPELDNIEVLFLSYDLDFYPATDFALVLGGLPNAAFDAAFDADSRSGAVGDYYVVATSPESYQTIAGLSEANSMANADDLRYMTTVLEPGWNGLIYLSEAFVQKLTGPAYRINAARRNAAFNAIETLQYAVFAYRSLTGTWPATISQMASDGYIEVNSVGNPADYSISATGIVSHTDWGSLYNPVAVSQVKIETASAEEVELYDRFAASYQELWRQFIDPVGIAISVGENISFHTVILPLIEESAYNAVRDFTLPPQQFDFIENPDRSPAAELLFTLNVEGLAGWMYRENNWRERDISNAEAATKAKTELAEALDWNEPEDIFSFVGDEIVFAMGEEARVDGNDFSRLDFYLGIELADQALAEKFLEHVYAWYANELGGRGRNEFDMFAVDPTRPITNNYNGVDYYTVPAFFFNVHYVFLNNRFYIAASQLAMNNIIDQATSGEDTRGEAVSDVVEDITNNHQAMLLIDGEKIRKGIELILSNQWSEYQAEKDFKRHYAYYEEMLALASQLPGFDGTITAADNYYHNAPTQWFDATLSSANDTMVMTVGSSTFSASDIILDDSYGYYYGYSREEEQDRPTVGNTELEVVTSLFNKEASLAGWDGFKALGIGMAMTEDGLDIRLAINNPNESTSSRGGNPLGNMDKEGLLIYIVAGVVALLAILLIIKGIARKGKGGGGRPPVGPSSGSTPTPSGPASTPQRPQTGAPLKPNYPPRQPEQQPQPNSDRPPHY